MKKIPLESLVFGLAFVVILAKMFAGYPPNIQVYLQIAFYWIIAVGLILGAMRQPESWRKYTLFICSGVLLLSLLQLSQVPTLLYSVALLVGVFTNKRQS